MADVGFQFTCPGTLHQILNLACGTLILPPNHVVESLSRGADGRTGLTYRRRRKSDRLDARRQRGDQSLKGHFDGGLERACANFDLFVVATDRSGNFRTRDYTSLVNGESHRSHRT
jgi:hypothetical protein